MYTHKSKDLNIIFTFPHIHEFILMNLVLIGSSLNMVAFTKILKKFDKVLLNGISSSFYSISVMVSIWIPSTSNFICHFFWCDCTFHQVANQQASASYLKVVKKSHFITSDKVQVLNSSNLDVCKFRTRPQV